MAIENELAPFYTTDKNGKSRPKSFLQATENEYNALLNNHRSNLGDYYKNRAQFAKYVLYKEKWPSIYSFSFIRNPIDRVKSLFFYLHYTNNKERNPLLRYYWEYKSLGKMSFTMSKSFDHFLEMVELALDSSDFSKPFGNRFLHHVNPFSNDLLDKDGTLLVNDLFDIIQIEKGLNTVFEKTGIDKKVSAVKAKNITKNKVDFDLKPHQKQKLESIYKGDFELYETL